MSDPMKVLGISANADAETIRQRYLELIRTYSPERDPERFREIRAAYELVSDPLVRIHAKLFDAEEEYSLQKFADQYRPDFRQPRLSTELLLSLVR